MNLQISTQQPFTVVAIHGRLDTVSAAAFENQLLDVLDKGAKQLLLDCANLEYISSSGLRVFLIAQKRMLAVGGKLYLAALRPNIREIFDISGFSTIFSIFTDTETAVKSK